MGRTIFMCKWQSTNLGEFNALDQTRLIGILQPQLTANLLDARLDFLDVVRGVVSLADDTIADWW
jgi:hypothetical protein